MEDVGGIFNGGIRFMRIHDISMTISYDMSVYKNIEEKRPLLIRAKKIPEDNINESSIKINLHTGTHIDAPFHIYNDGNTIEAMDLNRLITKCFVLDMTEINGCIKREDLLLKRIPKECFILLKTKNSYTEEFQKDYVYLTQGGAEYLRSKEIIGVGIDSLGIEREQPLHETHKLLLESGIIIIEGLRLKAIEEKEYTLIALPLKILGADGSPIRAVLLDELS
jgi:arylformamidase